MDENLIILISFILIIMGWIGTLLPVLPGLVLSYGGLLLYKFGTTNDLSIIYIWVFGFLVLAAIILDYVIPAKLNRKYGGTRWGSIGSVLGTILGLIFIPIPLGFLIGMLGGVFIAELLHDYTDTKKAFNSVKGAFLGFLMGAGFNFIVAFAILMVVIINSI